MPERTELTKKGTVLFLAKKNIYNLIHVAKEKAL